MRTSLVIATVAVVGVVLGSLSAGATDAGPLATATLFGGEVKAFDAKRTSGPAMLERTSGAADRPEAAVRGSSEPDHALDAEDLKLILEPLMSSPDSRRLAASVAALLRRGALDEAQTLLTGAIEGGTLASLMIDRLQEPALLVFLETTKTAQEPRLPELRAKQAPAGDSIKFAELKTALARETERANTLQRERDAAQKQVLGLKDSQAKLSGEKEALIQEKTLAVARSDAAVRDLEMATKQITSFANIQDFTPAAFAFRLPVVLRPPLDPQEPLAARYPQEDVLNRISGDVQQLAQSRQAEASSRPSADTVASVTGTRPADSVSSLKGRADVVDTSTLRVHGKLVRLFGVEPMPNMSSDSNDLLTYLNGREVSCQNVGAPDTYRCLVAGKDLSQIILFNGGGRATAEATVDLKRAEELARVSGAGLWKPKP